MPPTDAQLAERLAARLAQLLPRCRTDAHLLSITLFVDAATRPSLPHTGSRLLWRRPDEGTCLVGSGEAARLTAAGEDRLKLLTRETERLFEGWSWHDPDQAGGGPRAFIGFAFDPEDEMSGGWSTFPNTALIVPRVLAERTRDGWAVTFTATAPERGNPHCLLGVWRDTARHLFRSRTTRHATGVQRSDAFPNDGEWLRLAGRALDAIADRELEKVVPYRTIRLLTERMPDPRTLIETLTRSHHQSSVLAAGFGRATLVAATPERLVSVRDRTVVCDALAATAATGTRLGGDKAEREHGAVVDHLRRSLEASCTELTLPPAPRRRVLPGLQHLWTPLRGRLRPGESLLSVAARIHPTPAVCGTPPNAARAWLNAAGQTRRGWYSGAFGWLQPDGEGELAVVLRCALLGEGEAHLFAGAGIVAGSDPVAELAETELKLAGLEQAMAIAWADDRMAAIL